MPGTSRGSATGGDDTWTPGAAAGLIGGMDTATCYHRGTGGAAAETVHEVFRIGPNDWGMAVAAFEEAAFPEPAFPERSTGPDHRAADLRSALQDLAAGTFRPSDVLAALNAALLAAHPRGRAGHLRSVVFARLELDVCGAWVTLAHVGAARPIVVRQAGWIDIRGHAAAPHPSGKLPTLRDDRVGLGPGDALVVCSEGIGAARDAHGDYYLDHALPELLLRSIGRPAHEIADRVGADALEFGAAPPEEDGVVMVIRVPPIERGRARERVTAATGMAADELELPGYPLGDVQPDLWRVPNPPREARINLTPEPLSVPALRRLLRRLLQSWRIAGADDCELLATEVATNVFASAPAASTVTVVVRYDGEVVRVEIGDKASAASPRMVPGYDELSGPGLLLVDALSSDWGVISTGASRRVWFEVPATPETGA